MENVIIEYVTDKETNKSIGIIVAARVDGNVYNIDYSYVHPEDRFDKKFGRDMAVKRATSNRHKRVKMRLLNEEVLSGYMSMIERATRCFKDCVPSEKVSWMKNAYHYSSDDKYIVSYSSNINIEEPRIDKESKMDT